MNCKPGDLAILLRATNPALVPHVGGIRTVVRRSDYVADAWYLDPPVFGGNGLQASWMDKDLRPIRPQPDDAVDEMVQKLGKPEEVTA